jgi:hypothetical protein
VTRAAWHATAVDDRDLCCTWCGRGPLHVELGWPTVGHCEVAGFHCDDERCGAQWEADGTVREPGATRLAVDGRVPVGPLRELARLWRLAVGTTRGEDGRKLDRLLDRLASPASPLWTRGDPDPRWWGADFAARAKSRRPLATDERSVALEYGHDEHLGWLYPDEARELAGALLAAADWSDGAR